VNAVLSLTVPIATLGWFSISQLKALSAIRVITDKSRLNTARNVAVGGCGYGGTVLSQ
jgi:hypothetical protein